MDTSSLTSRIMLRILMTEHWKIAPRVLDFTPPVQEGLRIADAALSIGDSSFDRFDPSVHRIDLGEVWKEFSGLPFVYALWVTRAEIDPEELREPFTKAQRKGEENINVLAEKWAKNSCRPAEFFSTYLLENLSYDLGEREREGMDFFFAKAKDYINR